MPPDSVPPDVRRLLDERAAARQARDFDRADALRDQIAGLGWEVQDAGAASSARPMLAGTSAVDDGSVLDQPPTVDASVQLAAEDHVDDFVRAVRGLATHPPASPWELLVVDNAASFDVAGALASEPLPVDPVNLAAPARLGWADARTLGLQRSRGEITILLDTSLEPAGDFVTPLLRAFDDASVGLAGGWGVTSADARQFEDAPPGEVDAIEAYCLAIRREALRAIGGFDRRFRYYRNADLDFSFAVRDAGWRAVRTEPLPLVRHEHRGWESLPEEERERLSRRNFYRFLDRWRDRPDLLLHPDGR
ncbi:MAG TPA: glycosyltransferase [Candidatus Limnocylindria bacterium]|nr:glycosyltransferase [Candidatus Limnocylindria bacterium]